ncbi:hypothetical protein Cgig2_023185 [Carnegiea gigantea]|uniref:Glycosyltransferase 61 catalytic domain-containing protein n=1 Tax=Carnegiea gigantea TaxID=171969 RepID=A0A9Q1JYL0_9CARY|nr:hypothetical protein Cgig2_023185 [Carnegiea gigantea]
MKGAFKDGHTTSSSKKKRSEMVKDYATAMLVLSFSLMVLGSVFRRLNLPPPLNSTSFTVYPEAAHEKHKPVIRWDPRNSSQHLTSKITCDRSHYHYDTCSISGPTSLDPTTSTFYAIGPTWPKNFIEKIRPYPRKWENFTMSKIKEVSLKPGPRGPVFCNVVHNARALVFSAGGYTGNFFHEFNEGFLPLFITVRSMSLSDQDVVLVITEAHDWWIRKYVELLGTFSKYPIVTLDNETGVHCFSSATVGLVSHGFMTIDPKLMPNPTKLAHFHALLDKAYGQAQRPIAPKSTGQPKLVFVARTGGVGRVMLNQAQVLNLAQELGFDATVFEPEPNISLRESYRLISRSHVMVGVHGAAMTHLLFLRPGSIFIQVVPIGIDPIAELCYGHPAKEMGLEYLEYKVRIEESSLIEKYNTSDPILTNPMALHKKGWSLLKKVYLKDQNVSVDLPRFRGYLTVAYTKAKRFMHRVG